MTNNHVTSDIDAFVHDALADDRAAEVRKHCETCTTCGKELEAARQRKQQLQSLPPVEASEELIQKTIDVIAAKEERKSQRWKKFGWIVVISTLAASLIIGGFHAYYATLTPSPIDLRLLGQTQLLANGHANFRVRAIHAVTGAPLVGEPIEVSIRNEETGETVTLASFETNDQGEGIADFKTPDWPGEHPLTVRANSSVGRDAITRKVVLNREWKLMISTDKPVYKPGQAIQMRALALRRPDLKPVIGQSVTYRVTDPKGNLIFKREDVGGEFGITSATCQLAEEILLGDYVIDVEAGETSSSTTVTVDRYTLPKLKVAVSLNKPFYQPGELVEGTVQADYFFGKHVVGGDVEVKFGGGGFSRLVNETIELTTDEEGQAKFEYRLPDRFSGRPQDGGSGNFGVVAVVTDTAGQKYGAQTQRLVVENAIQMEVIPELPTLVRDQPNKIYVFARYPNGQPVQATLLVSGVNEKLTTNKLGVASFDITPDKNNLQIVVKATNARSQTGRKSVNLSVGGVSFDYIVRADRAVYRSGDTVDLLALGGGVQPVFVDLIQQGQAVMSQTISMEDGKGSAAIDLPTDLFGTFRLVTHRFGPDGLAVRKSQLLYVEQAKEIKIEATFDSKTYRPGEKAKLKVRLTDSQGKPAPGALSLAAVDEAVFAVLGGAQGLEKAFFLLEQELLEPVYAIYNNWSPESGGSIPSEEREEFHQAVFASGTGVSYEYGDVGNEFLRPPTPARPGDADSNDDMAFEVAPDVGFGNMNNVGDTGETPYTLYGATYQTKVNQVEEQRKSGLRGSIWAWVALACCLVLTGVGAFAVSFPRVFTVIAIMLTVVGVPLVGCSIWFAAHPARDMAMNEAGMAAPEAMDEFGVDMAADNAFMDGAEPGGDDGFADGGFEGEPEESMFGDNSEPADEAVEPATQPQTAKPRVRKWFPETLVWKPQLVTNEAGEAELEIPLADSITSWRMSASAISANGDMGSARFPIRVFQPFFVDLDLPVALTRNDYVGVRAVVSNYLDKPQTVELKLNKADWFDFVVDTKVESTETPPTPDDEPATEEATVSKFVELKPGEVKAVTFMIQVRKVGVHSFDIMATADTMADAVKREIEVLPGGTRIDNVASGSLDGEIEVTINTPEDAIEGSPKAILKIHPSSFSQLVEGLDSIFRMPNGCFEQTSSTTYPNILALEYMRQNKLAKPEIEAKALQYIQVGYQRLVSFEVNGGGFDWFGNPPANQTLTAYGLMEFEDMSRLKSVDVDPALIARTRNWLIARRHQDGSWKPEPNMLDDGLASSVLQGDANVGVTAYIAWAVFGTGAEKAKAAATLNWLTRQSPATIEDPYTLAILAQAIAGIDKDHASLKPILDRLESMKKTTEDGKQVFWDQPQNSRTMFYGGGKSGSVETTALVALTLMQGGRDPAMTRKALTWLIAQKDPSGLWYSTQATVLALRALLAGSSAPLGDAEKTRIIQVEVDGQPAQAITIPPDQADVMQQINLSQFVQSPGEHKVVLRDDSNTSPSYHLAYWHHIEAEESPADEPLSIDIVYDKARLNVDDTITATASVKNNQEIAAPMVILDLPIPGGFIIEPGEFDELVGSKLIAKYQITPRKAIVYLTGIAPGDKLELRYRLKATMPVELTTPAGQAYEYYNPAKRGESKPAKIKVIDA